MISPNNNYTSTNLDNHNQRFTLSNGNDYAKSIPFLARVIRTQAKDIGEHQAQDFCDHQEKTFDQNDEVNLFVETNDVIVLQSASNTHYSAQADQQFGKIPKDHCQLLDDEIPRTLCNYILSNNYFDLYICFASFVAQDVGDLSLTKGDIIIAVEQVNEHWVRGQVCFDGQANRWQNLRLEEQLGCFPLNHCWKLDSNRLKSFCQFRLNQNCLPNDKTSALAFNQPSGNFLIPQPPASRFTQSALAKHSSSLSSYSSSVHSNESQQQKPPPRPEQIQRSYFQKSNSEQPQQSQPLASKSSSLLTLKQQDKLKSWLHTVKKKTSRLSTRITARLGLISLTRDEEFERHHENLKQIEKTIRVFIKNLTTFVEHFESFLLALQNTSENLSDFYRDKSHQKELEELRRKNKALACEHFHSFKRTVERQVIAVANQLLQKFVGPHQMINKRSAKLLDFDTKTKEMESCRDLVKKEALRDQYVIAKELYDRINRQLIDDLPVFNQFALEIFRECILILLDGRRNLMVSYTKQTASLLKTPLMMTYTASDVASTIFTSSLDYGNKVKQFPQAQIYDIYQERKDSGHTSGHDTRQSSGNDDYISSRPCSAASHLTSELDNNILAAKDASVISHEFQVEEISPIDVPDACLTSTPNKAQCASEETDGESTMNKKIVVHNQSSKAPDLPKPASVGQTPSQSRDSKLSKDRRRKKKFPIYIAEWPFVSTGPNQLTISSNQPLKLIKGCDECGNSDWSLVQDKKGQLGYVPTSYIRKKD